MAIEKELLDQLLSGRDPNEVYAKDGLLDDLKKALSERILNAELDEHLDGERVEGGVNRRDGHSKKSVLTGTSRMTLSIPRDGAGRSIRRSRSISGVSPTSTTRLSRGMRCRLGSYGLSYLEALKLRMLQIEWPGCIVAGARVHSAELLRLGPCLKGSFGLPHCM
jgi:hypothetical protein